MSRSLLLMSLMVLVGMAASQTCHVPTYPLVSSKPAYIDSSISTFDHGLNLAVRIPANFYGIDFSFSNSGSSCDGNSDWTQTSFDNGACEAVWQRVVPWSNAASSCGGIVENGAETLTYRFYFTVHSHENVTLDSDYSFVRYVEHPLSFVVHFPRFVNVSKSIVATSNNITQAGIYSFSADVSSTVKHATIVFITTTVWPYTLASGTGGRGGGPTGPTVTSTLTADGVDVTAVQTQLTTSDCPDDSSKVCVQYWEVDVQFDSAVVNRCNFTGIYVLHFTSSCQASTDAHPCNHLAIEVPASVASSSFCGDLVAIGNIGLTGTLESYYEAAHSNVKSSFLVSDTAYFLLSTNSNEATIESTKILTIKAQSDLGQSYTYYDYSGSASASTPFTTGAGSAASLSVSGGSTTNAFEFVLTDAQYPLSFQARSVITVSVTAYVKFANTGRRLLTISYTMPAGKPELSASRLSNAQTSSAVVGLGFDSFAVNKQLAWNLATRSVRTGPKLIDLSRSSSDPLVDAYRMLLAPSVAFPLNTRQDSAVSTRSVFGLRASKQVQSSNVGLSNSDAVSSSPGMSPAAQAGLVAVLLLAFAAVVGGVVLFIRRRAQKKWLERMSHMSKAQNETPVAPAAAAPIAP